MDGQNVDTAEPNFDDAFEELSSMLDGEGDAIPEPAAEEEEVVEEETAEAEVEEAEEVAEEDAAEEEAAEEDAAEETAEGEPEEEPEEAPDQVPPPESQEDMLKRLADMLAESKKSAPEPEPEPAPAAQADEPELYTPEELKFLESYEEEWGDVSKAESLKRRAEYRQIVDYVFNEVAQQLTPLAQNLRAVSERAHLQDLQSTVGDYDVVRDQVVEWVEQQPEYLQTAYKHVINNGTVDEVADLIDRYKRESGVMAQPQAEQQQRTRKKETELPATTKKAAASLAPVSSKRSVVPQGEDPTDFEAAFASFAGKL